jgi:hypothetical protein
VFLVIAKVWHNTKAWFLRFEFWLLCAFLGYLVI